MIMRLIDIVLIVLFGFISMSTLVSQRKVRLAESEEMKYQLVERETEIVEITIDAWNGIYVLESLDEVGSRLPVRLKKLKTKFDEENKRMKVSIRADKEADMKTVKYVTKICDLLEVERQVIVKYKSESKG
ncbi:hypothetical protein GF324_06145 [bacterium]|nr:hypothetical protein [bacterium]